jgi:hypothetical protein
MKPDAGSGILVTARELEERLSQELAIIDWRAVLAVVVAAPGLEPDAEQACRKAIEAAGIDPGLVVQLAVSRDDTGTQQLESINRARDTLLPAKRLVLLHAAHAADVRFLRQTAPDLVSATDLFVELMPYPEAGPQRSWPTCGEHIRALMEERHSELDLTGLLPASMGQRKLPLPALHQPLVHLRPSGHHRSAQPSDGLLVLGHPGTGKTTFVRFLAWTYARRASDPLGIGAKVPLLLSLSDYGHDREHDRIRSLVDFLPLWLAQQNIENASTLTEHLSEVLLLLDGLDDIRVPEARHAVLVEVSELLREKRVGGIVVTGRSFLIDEVRRPDHALRVVSTQEPSWPQIEAFLATFTRLCQGDRASPQHLVSRIARDPDLRALARSPLMLTFMAVLDELEGRLPDRRIEIYYRVGELLVDRWTRAHGMDTRPSHQEQPTPTAARRVLGSLAWLAVERGGGTIDELELTREIERTEGSGATPEAAKVRARALLESLRSNATLLVPQTGGRWAFVHGSIGEYLAGAEVERDETRWTSLLGDLLRPEWREIVLFCAGQLGAIEHRTNRLETLVKAVLATHPHEGRHESRYPSLLIGLLEEAPGLDGRLIDALMRRLLESLTRTVYPRAVAGQVRRELLSLLLKARGPLIKSFDLQLHRFDAMRRDDTDWLFRIAEWYRHRGSAAHQRTVGEVAREVEIDR